MKLLTKKSRIFILTLCTMLTPLLWRGAGVRSQNVGISSTGATPDNSAMLDVVSNTKGMLIPRMTGTEKYAVPSPATGLLIFQTDTVGFWYYNGTKWLPLLSSTSSTSGSTGGWGLSGNDSTTASNFLGTTDNVSLRFRTNDTTRVIVDSLGRVGVGVLLPGYLLHVVKPSTVTSGTEITSGTVLSVDPSGASSADYRAGLFQTLTSSTNGNTIANLTGVNGQAQYRGTSTCTSAFGTSSTAFLSPTAGNSATLSNAYGSYARIANQGTVAGAVITNAYTLFAASPSNSSGGTIANTYGVYIQNQTTGIQTNTPFGIYQAGTADLNYFAGSVGIGCSDPKYKLHVIGDIASSATIRGVNAYVTGAITACSDLRYKKDITPLPNALNKVMKLQGVNYRWKTKEFPEKNFTNEKQIGFIAQEIEKIYPEVVMTDKDGYKSVDYSRLTPVLVEAIKEQQKIIDSLNSGKENAEERIVKLEAAVQKLMQTVDTEEVKK